MRATGVGGDGLGATSGNLLINTPGVNSADGLYVGNGDQANFSTADVAIESWWGLGFKSSCYNNNSGYGIVFDTRAGNIYTQGSVGIGTASPSSKLTVTNGSATAANQIFNNLELQLAGFSGTYPGIGTGILFDTGANGGANNAPVAQVMGYLTDGGSNGSNYAGTSGLRRKVKTTQRL